MQTLDADVIDHALQAISPAGHNVVRLLPTNSINEDNFEYADLIKGGGLGRRVGAVIEKDGAPLIYLAEVPADQADTGQALARLLGNRGETALLLDVHTALDGRFQGRAWPCVLDASTYRGLDFSDQSVARSILGDLQQGLWNSDARGHQEQCLRDLLVSSVDIVSQKLASFRVQPSGQTSDDLALVGRALFTRFLIDRAVLTAKTAPALWPLLGNCGEQAFATVQSAAAVCDWLDRTFNGEFMPLSAHDGYIEYFKDLECRAPDALVPLNWIVGRTNAGGQLPLWDRLDFSYIPVGTLSEVYENYVRRRSPKEAKKESVHFTPRHIARMMVRQALAGVPNEIEKPTVLDPAVGAGVFLSLAYRELTRRQAARDGVWPDTKSLRDILYNQLLGMDINPDAINLTALTLYLTAIELDADPVPPEKLRFTKPLVGAVLHNVGRIPLGSLGENTGISRKFNIVIGNPPWTSIEAADDDAAEGEDAELGEPSSGLNAERVFGQLATQCLAQRGIELEEPYSHPDKVPDLAFVWKASQWAESGGVIAFIVHQRLLIKRSPKWKSARQALLAAFQVDGIIDGSEFANHANLIWPGVESPFCIMFARNQLPAQNHSIRILSLTVEPPLSKRRHLRLDPFLTFTARAYEFEEEPAGLVVRMRGCELDRMLLQRWQARNHQNLRERGTARLNRRSPLTTVGACLLAISVKPPLRGVKTGKKRTKAEIWSDYLSSETREIGARDSWSGEVPASAITGRFQPRPTRSAPGLYWYEPPILLLRQAAGRLQGNQRALLITPSDGLSVIYPFAFIGTPLKDDAESLMAAKFIALWVNSCIFSYYQTVTSTQFTFQIKAFLSEEMLSTPIVLPMDALTMNATSANEIETLFKELSRPTASTHTRINEWAHRILGSDEFERQLIDDTLSVSYPIGPSRQCGHTWAPASQAESYVKQLRSELSRLSNTIDLGSVGMLPGGNSLAGWHFATWRCHAGSRTIEDGDHPSSERLKSLDEEELVRLVRERYPEGQVWAKTEAGDFIFGQLALRKLWLPSRASLMASVIAAWVEP